MYLYFIIAAFIINGNGFENFQSTNFQKWFATKYIPYAYILQYEPGDVETSETRANDIKVQSNDHMTGVEYEDQYNIIQQNDNTRIPRNVPSNTKDNRLVDNAQPNIKAKLRYHHEQRHPNGSVSGTYGQMEPSGKLRVVHYEKDSKGYREFEEEPSANSINKQLPIQQPINQHPVKATNPPVVQGQEYHKTNPNAQNEHSINLNNRRGIFGPLNTYNPQSPIVQSAIIAVQPYGEKSPLYDKYYRPSPEEVQKAYDYHRLRSAQDPGSFRSQDATQINLPPPTGRPEVTAVYGEYQSPVTSAQYHDSYPNGYYVYSGPPNAAPTLPQYAAPPILYNQPPEIYNQPPDQNPQYYPPAGQLYIQNPYPQSLPPQSPVYIQANDPNFVPASTYNGPLSPNTATFNQPYPTNIPIYNTPIPQNVPTYVQRAPDNIPVYQQGIAPQQPIPPGLPGNVLAYAGVNPNNLVSAK